MHPAFCCLRISRPAQVAAMRMNTWNFTRLTNQFNDKPLSPTKVKAITES